MEAEGLDPIGPEDQKNQKGQTADESVNNQEVETDDSVKSQGAAEPVVSETADEIEGNEVILSGNKSESPKEEGVEDPSVQEVTSEGEQPETEEQEVDQTSDFHHKAESGETETGAKEEETSERQASSDRDVDERAQRLAAAKEQAAAVMKAREEAQVTQPGNQPATLDTAADERAKRIAEAKAKAAAAAKARGEAGADRARPERPRRAREEKAEPEELPPSPLQPLLDKYVAILKKELGDDCLEEAYINRLSKDVPSLVAKKETYLRIAETLHKHPELDFNFLSELHGTDFQTHMEVYLHLFSFTHKHSVALKVKLDRDNPEIESVTQLWAGANWPECEAYDLLGIRFSGHPKLHRIFLGEDWVGHPLRKDYEPYDVEV